MQKNIYEKWNDGGVTILPPRKVLKLVYKRRYFDLETRRVGCREVTTISCDGRIEQRLYKYGSRKVQEMRTATCPLAAFAQLCDALERCIQEADCLDIWADDTSAELEIHHPFGRVQTVDRAMGSANASIGGIICGFFAEYAPTIKV